jgi:hypothetical protein
MERAIGAVLLAIFLSLAESALAGTPGQEESVALQTCGAFQRDTVPQSICIAEFIDEHVESVPPQEQMYCKRNAQPLSSDLIPGVTSCF